ncbi:MAG: hypothetical protein AAFP70_15350 [Calditrichota bacterium]
MGMEIIVYLIIMGLVSIYNAWKKKQQPQSKGPTPQAPRPQQRPQQTTTAQQSRSAEARSAEVEAPPNPPEIRIPEFLRDLLDIPDPEPEPPPKPRVRMEYAEPDMPARQFHDHEKEGTLHDWSKVHPEGPPIKKKKRKPKKKTPLAEMLSSKRSLRKSIIIKEILDKPVSMRPRSPIGHR